MTNIAGSGSESGSISQRHGSEDPDPDPPENVMDPQHWLVRYPYLSPIVHHCIGRILTLFSVYNHADLYYLILISFCHHP
jgi:hypothetical protein